MIEAGFFVAGFLVASWLSWRAQAKQREAALKAFQAYKTEVLRLLERAQDLTDIRITIIDRNGELELETEEDPPAAPSSRPPKGLH